MMDSGTVGSGSDWGMAIVLDPRELTQLETDNARLRARHGRRTRVIWVLCMSWLLSTSAAYWERCSLAKLARAMTAEIGRCKQQMPECRKSASHTSVALAALARSQENILSATEQAPTLGTKSWGRRFTVTKYLPHDPKYGRDDDGLTATLMAADPAARIAAVDPTLIPYGSRVWIERLAWFQAHDCGRAAKGPPLDRLTAPRKHPLASG